MSKTAPLSLLVGLALMVGFFLLSPNEARADNHPILIGLDADMSSGSALSGEAIRRGTAVAIAEINESGGLLGRPLMLTVRDHRGNPSRGKDNIIELAEMKNLLAVMGGIHTPVAMAELDLLHDNKIIYLSPWAAGTPVVDNGKNPNYVFRVSVRDQFAGRFLVKGAAARGYKKLGLLFERTGWGRSNEKAFAKAADELGIKLTGVQWLNWGAKDLTAQIKMLKADGAEAVMLVANPREGVIAVKNMASLPADQRLPIISHWGITGGRFAEGVGEDLQKVNLSVLQTMSFMNPPRPDKAASFLARYYKMYKDTSKPEDIRAGVGAAHAYDLMHLLGLAVKQAGSLDRARVRDALEAVKHYKGLVRVYNPPFSPSRHDALSEADFSLARYGANGILVPASR